MTQSSLARRQRRLKRKGRPIGSHRSLLADPRRFSIAAWHAFSDAIGSHPAARLAVVLLEETTPITIEDLEGVLVVASSSYEPPRAAKKYTLDDRAFDLARRAKLVADRATRREMDWLVTCSGALRAVVFFIAANDAAGASRALEILRGAGWTEVIEHVRRRFEDALCSNFPPFEGRLRAAARQLLAERHKTLDSSETCAGI
jgi:hypothetical protein